MIFTFPNFKNGRFPLSIFFFFFSFFEAPSDAKRAHPFPHHARLTFSWLALFARRPYFLRACHKLRACLHGGGGPHVGEITRLGGVRPPAHIVSHFNFITFI